MKPKPLKPGVNCAAGLECFFFCFFYSVGKPASKTRSGVRCLQAVNFREFHRERSEALILSRCWAAGGSGGSVALRSVQSFRGVGVGCSRASTHRLNDKSRQAPTTDSNSTTTKRAPVDPSTGSVGRSCTTSEVSRKQIEPESVRFISQNITHSFFWTLKRFAIYIVNV